MPEPIVQEIEINAAPDRIYGALSDCAQIKKWWGTETSYQVAQCEFDLQVGGAWRSSGGGNDGSFEVHGIVKVVDPPKTFSYTWIPDWDPYETIVRFDIGPTGGGSRVTLTHDGFKSETDRVMHNAGWMRVLNWLKKYAEAS